MLFQTVIGNETFPVCPAWGGTFRLLAFYKANASAPEVPYKEAATKGYCQRIGTEVFINASAENRNYGMWINSRYNVPDFSFTKILVARKDYTNFIARSRQIVLYHRPDSALRRITFPFTGHPDAVLDHGAFEGTFDIVPYSKFKSLGIVIPDQFVKSYKIDNYSELFSEQIIEPERTKLIIPKSETIRRTTGEEVRIFKPVSRRKIKLR